MAHPIQFDGDAFVVWLRRRAQHETLAQIADSMGVSGAAVSQWMHGSRPSRMALILGAMLARGERGTWPEVEGE
ncbi:MAG: helix-turn-helix transcriptional regulator [Terriglobales bacterium]